MKKKKAIKKTPLDWASNPLLMEHFPNYEAFLLWAEENEERINKIEDYLSRTDAKVIKVITRDPRKGRESEKWFTKKEYEKWKRQGEQKEPNARCSDCLYLSGLICTRVDREIPCDPDEYVVCTFFLPRELD